MSAISSLSSSSGSTAALLQRLAQQLSASSSSSSSSKTGGYAAVASATSSSANAGRASAAPSGPPPLPPEFSVQRSTVSMGSDPIAGLDSNADGQVSAGEFGLTDSSAGSSSSSTGTDATSSQDKLQKLFKAIDTSGDGQLSTDELSSFRDKMTQSMHAHAGGRGSGTDPIAGLDSDGDSQVSASEFGLTSSADSTSSTGSTEATSDQGKLQQLFKAIDTSGDGQLSTDELSSFRDKMMQSMQRGGGAGHMQAPPADGATAVSGTGGTAASSSTAASSAETGASSASKTEQAQDFVKLLAERYASMMAQQASATRASTSLSLTA